MLLAISGPSAIGKDATWLSCAESFGFHREVPYTTRRRRSGEIEGHDYRFISVDDFQSKIKNGALTDWDYTLGNYYGTDLSLRRRILAGEDVALPVLARMAIRLKTQLVNVRTVLLLTSDRRVIEDRLKARGYSGYELTMRLAHADEEEAHTPLFDFVVPDADILAEAQVMRILDDIVPARL